MAIAHAATRRGATVDATPEGVIILTALAAIPDVLPELGVYPGAVLAAAGVEPEKLPDPHSTVSFTAMGRSVDRTPDAPQPMRRLTASLRIASGAWAPTMFGLGRTLALPYITQCRTE